MKVTNLKIQLQDGTDSTVYASWDFTDKKPSSGGGSGGSGGSGGTGGAVKAGSIVKVNQGATWYNGASIASFVYNYNWIVLEVRGDRAVINKSTTGSFAIMSPISTSNLTVVG